MQIKIYTFGITLLAASGLVGQPYSRTTLPRGIPIKNTGPRVYSFAVDYFTAGVTGEIERRQRIIGEYTRLANGKEVVWRNVTQADAQGLKPQFGAPRKRDFMEGFRYPNDLIETFKPDFFRGFPATAVYERNLVWDTGMIEHYGQGYFEHLQLNAPHHVLPGNSVTMPGVGSFRNRDVVLEWIGISRRNGQDCAVILYKAFFNPVQLDNAGMTMRARSDYWGEIWVSLATKQIEYGTIYESVVGQMKPGGQDASRSVNVFRVGVLRLASSSPGER